MFDKEFYPTPPELIKKMLEPYAGEYHYGGINGYMKKGYIVEGSILEPSVGKGDILDFIDEHSNSRMRNAFACEQSPELQAILRDKGYPIVSADFLSYEADMYFDHIIMNPPFSNGDEHLLKALQISDDTQITCILNAETIRNPFSQKRKELIALLEKYNYEVEYVQDAFKDAERTTGVEIALVRVKVPQLSERFSFNFKDEDIDDVNIGEDFKTNEIARKDVIGNMIHIFEKAKEAYIVHMEAEAKFQYYANMLKYAHHMDEDDFTTREGNYRDRFNYYCQRTKGMMWRTVIDHLDIDKYMSSSVINNFDKFIQQQSKMAFTKDNTYDFFNMIMMNTGNILEQAILEVFDELTKYTKENRLGVEGWKTNDAYKVNQRVIAPYLVKFGEYQNAQQNKEWGADFRVNYSRRSKYADLDKVLCYITGKDLNKIVTINQILDIRFREIGKIFPGDKFDNTCESEFFDIKFYKKGTAHLKFKDKKLWEQFNLRAAAQKNWLPEGMYEKEMAKYQPKSKPQPQSEPVKEELLLESPSIDISGDFEIM